MLFLSLWSLAGFVAEVIIASFFEWTLHRFVMHRPMGWLRYPFQAHAVVHRQTFKADHTYHLHDDADKETIPMAWWNGPLLIAIGVGGNILKPDDGSKYMQALEEMLKPIRSDATSPTLMVTERMAVRAST